MHVCPSHSFTSSPTYAVFCPNNNVTIVEYVIEGSHSAAIMGAELSNYSSWLQSLIKTRVIIQVEGLIVLRRDMLRCATVYCWQKSMSKQAVSHMNPETWRAIKLLVVAWSYLLSSVVLEFSVMYMLCALWCRLWVGEVEPAQETITSMQEEVGPLCMKTENKVS